MSRVTDEIRLWWAVIRARGQLSIGLAAFHRAAGQDGAAPADLVGRPVADHNLGLCDACHLAWGVEVWIHPTQLLVTVLCARHSRQQATAMQERLWSRLIQPRCVTTTTDATPTASIATRRITFRTTR